MSNLIGTRHESYRWKLLSSVSAFALATSFYLAGSAEAASSEQPSLWLEAGWQYEGVNGLGEKFDPAFVKQVTAAGFESPLSLENHIGYSYGGEGKILFAPEGTDWVFSASALFGRAHGRKEQHQQTAPASAPYITTVPAFHYHKTVLFPPPAAKFNDIAAASSETHVILDFMAGKDVGLGLQRSDNTSTLALGVRFAQFAVKTGANLAADPDFHFKTFHITQHRWFGPFYIQRPGAFFHTYSGMAESSRNFRGAGPSVSWNGTAGLVGNLDDGLLSADWGANAALLFGRQTTKMQHKTESRYHYYYQTNYPGIRGKEVQAYNHVYPAVERQHIVSVPDFGATAGLSLRWNNAKLSIGYRADFFVGALDGGTDTRKSITHALYGPFASISIGISPSDF